MAWGTSNNNLMTTMNNNQQSNFKMMNNLLTLQENHVEDFFQYHGEAFLGSFEKLIEDVTTRVVCSMLSKLAFVPSSNGNLTISPDALSEFQGITNENIQLDIQNLLANALNSEVIMQRRMAKQQYLEAQGFSGSSEGMSMPSNTSNIQGAPAMGGMNQQMMMQQQAFNNQSGYPIPPQGYDQFNNPYWLDPQTGQMSYTPPNSGLGLAALAGKTMAWAKWLA